MQKKAFFKSPLVIAAIICFIVAIAIPFFVKDSEIKETKDISQKASPTATSTPSPTISSAPTYVYKQTSGSLTATPTTAQTNSVNQQNPPATSTPQQNFQTSNSSAQTFQVSLKVNGSSIGSVDVQSGANQCDVLSKAKDQGKISSLLMKYDNSLGTYGVYQINGIGKENAVWWTYKVNGQAPSQGCSYIKANSGDNVEWQYVGS